MANKRFLLFILFFGFICFSVFSQTQISASLIEFRIREHNYTQEFSQNVKVTTNTRNGVKYLDIELTPLSNSVSFSGNIVGWRLYNDTNSNVVWKTSTGGGTYVPISNLIFIETIGNNKRLYLFEDGINRGSYNTNVLILSLPSSFNL